jgi:hypothetical protein
MKRSLPEPYPRPLPNRTQTLLLKACLLEKEAALKNWNEWILANQFDETTLRKSEGVLPQLFDKLDFGSQRLLPLLYKKMLSMGDQNPFVSQLKGYYRYVWVRNQLLKTQLSALVSQLAAEKINYVVIKGFPALEFFYRDLGARPVLDLDIAVYPGSWMRSVNILRDQGWREKFQYGNLDLVESSLVHAVPFIKNQNEIDLHSGFLHSRLPHDVEKEFWEGIQLYQPLHTMLKPEHQLICTFNHGYIGGDEASLRTVADATHILRSTVVDWDMFSRNVRSAQLMIPCTAFLEFIKKEELAEIPDEVIRGLNSIRSSKKHVAYFELAVLHSHPNGFKELRLQIYRASMLPGSLFKKCKVLVNTYKFNWGIKSVFGLCLMSLLVALDKSIFPDRKINGHRTKASWKFHI